ncbi:MAG: hypothetical protein Q4F57_09480 [Weeksellaceae bacterium]|nr:hypothetical protein [Weeksellaceae bacterium]
MISTAEIENLMGGEIEGFAYEYYYELVGPSPLFIMILTYCLQKPTRKYATGCNF